MLSEKPWKLPDFLAVMALLFILFLMSVGANLLGQGAPASADGGPQAVNFAIMLGLYLVIFGFVWLMVRARGVTWRSAFGFDATRGMYSLLLAMGVTMIVFPTARFLQGLSVDVMDKLHLEPVPQQSVQTLQTTISMAPQIYLAFAAIVAAPITEELLFRGILYPFVKQLGYPRLALWGTSIFFGMLHVNLAAFLSLVFLGLVLACLYEWTDNLAAPIFAHSLFNLANFVWAIMARQAT